MLVYLISLNILALDYFALRSIAGHSHVDTYRKNTSLWGERGGEISQRLNAKKLGKRGPALAGKKRSKGLGKKQKQIITLGIAAAIFVAMIGWNYARKPEKVDRDAIYRRLEVMAQAVRDELYEWEHLYNKDLTLEKFSEDRKADIPDYLRIYKPVYYNLEFLEVATPLADPQLEKQKEEIWKNDVEIFYRLGDINSLRQLRTLYYKLRDELDSAGLLDMYTVYFNLYAHQPFKFDKDAFNKRIDDLKEKKGSADLIKRAEFFRDRVPKMVDICNQYHVAREAAFAVMKPRQIEMMGIGKLIDEAK